MNPVSPLGARAVRCLAGLGLASVLAACHGVDPLLANPPPPTRPDVVLRTPYELAADLAQAARDEAAVRKLLAEPLWGDALSQSPEAFRAALSLKRPALAAQADALQARLGTLFTAASALGHTAQQLNVRLQAMDQVRAQTGFAAYVAQRADLFNQRADAHRAALRAGSSAAAQEAEAQRQRAIRDSGKVERIDYVNSAGRVVDSKYTLAHDEKQRARLLLPFAHAAAREQAERAASETEKAQRLAWVIEATRDGRIEAVERHLFQESDRITREAWPRLDAQHRALRAAMLPFSALTGHAF
ncbi:MAG: hypothetical protein J0L58_04025 [Burkholderiales bacterium]|uniref:hypothetical protein n=1 Tax=Inhella sp. TaxID=1921806 RepID=UPI001AC9655E|nr:hypothetical protein [Burkholderiales bacterium]